MEVRAMAIKRPSKSMGTPVRKSVVSPGLRHVEVRASHQMVPGDPYPGWLCKNKACARVIAVVVPPTEGKPPAGAEDQLAAVKCPHCGNEDLYRWGARSEHKYAATTA
jgi:hypothetical protein